MGEREITEFLTHLAAEKHVAASRQNQAFAALLFLYQQVPDRKLDFTDNVQRVTRLAKLPVGFTPRESCSVLVQLKGDYRLMAEFLNGSGLRLMECLRLRIKDIEIGYNRINVRDAKGLRERVGLSAANSRSATRSSRARLPRALLYLGSPILCLVRLIKTHGSYAKRDWGISEPLAHSRHFSRGTRGVAAVRIT
jgi:site-specific recombinase XerD